MLERNQPLALYMDGAVKTDAGKMGVGIIRFSPNPIACVIDAEHAGSDMQTVANMPQPVPIVASVAEAKALGAAVFVLGIAPPGGSIPEPWYGAIDDAVARGMSVVNGLHDLLAPRYPSLAPGQWVWDIRIEPTGLKNGSGLAAQLPNPRVLMIGTDMAVGKMTAGLQLMEALRQSGRPTEFVATGQIGITLTGRGVPLDAVRVDFATGAIEAEVLLAASTPETVVIVEGQGSLVHPGSTATLPLIRGSCPTHFVLCARAGQTALARIPTIALPPLGDLVRLYEDLAAVAGTFVRPQTVGVCLNTFSIASDEEARAACQRLEDELGLPVDDPVRHGCARLIQRIR